MAKDQVKVVVRTRPTSNFASKNLQLDITNQVLSKYLNDNNNIDSHCTNS